jgi:hypothetical protein
LTARTWDTTIEDRMTGADKVIGFHLLELRRPPPAAQVLRQRRAQSAAELLQENIVLKPESQPLFFWFEIPKAPMFDIVKVNFP